MHGTGLYIHVPFCRKKCIYCDFYSSISFENKDLYLNALAKELLFYKEHGWDNTVFKTIYIGGGTPSLLKPAELATILTHINDFLILEQNDITCETNPGTLEPSYYQEYKSIGINRVTIGVQSFVESELKTLSRIHSVSDAQNSIKLAHKSGIKQIGIDLIFGIPGQTLASWKYSVNQAIEMHPHHISIYNLTFEKNTPLHIKYVSGQLQKLDEELECDMFRLGLDLLANAGYVHYELSNLALPGQHSTHNLLYWNRSPFLGLGPSAHSFCNEKRWWNVSDTLKYIKSVYKKNHAILNYENINNKQQLMELILLGLRKREGLDLENWYNVSGHPFLEKAKVIIQKLGGIDPDAKPFEPSNQNKFFVLDHNNFSLTQNGLLLYDSICLDLCSIIE